MMISHLCLAQSAPSAIVAYAWCARPNALCHNTTYAVQQARQLFGSCLAIAAPWQAHREHRTFARLARHGHVAAHHARELARQGKAEPRPAEALSSRGIGLGELLEQLSLLLSRHADAGVGDGELDEAAAIAHLACRKLDLSRFSELARIAEEIEQNLPQPHGVHGQCAEVLSDFDDEAVLVLLGKLSGGVNHLVDQRC